MRQRNGEEGWAQFLKLCTKIKNPEEFSDFFGLFLTFEEREIMASRYLIIKVLLEGQLTQREIADQYKVSIAQITRGSNALKGIDPQFKKLLQQKLGVTKCQ